MRTTSILHRLAIGGLALFATGTVAHAQSPNFWQQDSFADGPAEFSGMPSVTYASPDDTVRINAAIGAMYLEGNEKVLNGNFTVSHLIWQTRTPVLRGSVAVDFGGGFSGGLEGSTAGFGSSYMEDYDWLRGDDTFANWSHRSQHPDTRLDHYFTGAASLGYELLNDDSAVIRAHAGFKYTDVQWTAYGGTYLYSNPGFRDTPGTIPDGVAGVTYRQQLPELFIGFDGEEQYGAFSVGGLLRGGVTFLSMATDNHYLRLPVPLRFVDSIYMAPTVTVGANVGFALGRNAKLTLAARYDHIFEQRGDVKEYNATTGALIGDFVGAAGAALRSAEITAGVQGSF
ncbi:MAG: omptin family outer membrane protease [Devosia sp.]|jgi:outer membrane protease